MKNFIKTLTKTEDNTSLLISRVVLGAIILPHGLQKLLGIFGGHGVAATIDAFNQWFNIPPFLTVLVILAESFGALFLILGLFSRFMAASIGAVMFGAIFMVTGRWGFFMNWYSEQRGEGYEFHILALGFVLIVMLGGGGKFSVDQMIWKKLK